MFNFFGENKEWHIYNNATREFINLYGIPCKYMKKELIRPDFVFGEDNALSEFNDFFNIKLYLEDMTRMTSQADLFTRFGLRIDDTLTLLVHQQELLEKLGPDRYPQPDDLIYFEFNNNIFEIFHIEEKEVFFPFGKCTTFRLQTRMMHYSHEKINTGVPEIDSTEELGDTNFDILSENELSTSQATVSSQYGNSEEFVATITTFLDFSELDPYKNN